MGVAIGNQDKINFGSARKSGLTTAFTAGLGKYLQTGSRFVDATEKVNSLTGLKQLNAGGNLIRGIGGALSSNLANKIEDGSSNFNWGGIAASALTSQVPTPKPTGNPLTDFTVSFTQNLITSAMSASLRDAVSGNGNTNYGLLAANAFGSALGNAIVSANLEEPRFKGTINTTKLDTGFAKLTQEFSDPGIPIQDGNNARVAQKAEENTQAALATKQSSDEQVANAKQVELDNRAAEQRKARVFLNDAVSFARQNDNILAQINAYGDTPIHLSPAYKVGVERGRASYEIGKSNLAYTGVDVAAELSAKTVGFAEYRHNAAMASQEQYNSYNGWQKLFHPNNRGGFVDGQN